MSVGTDCVVLLGRQRVLMGKSPFLSFPPPLPKNDRFFCCFFFPKKEHPHLKTAIVFEIFFFKVELYFERKRVCWL